MYNNYLAIGILLLGGVVCLLLCDTTTTIKLRQSILLGLHVWCGSKLFKHVLTYVPDNGEPDEDRTVVAVVFSNNEKYLNRVMSIMEDEGPNG
jgi:hypothetical protein